MVNTIYRDMDGTDVTQDVYVDYHSLVKEGKIDLAKLTALFLLVGQDDSEEAIMAFNSAMYFFALYMQCEGHLNFRSTRYRTIATANSEMIAILSPDPK